MRLSLGIGGIGLLLLALAVPVGAAVDPRPDMGLIAHNCLGCHGIDPRHRGQGGNIAGIPKAVMIDILTGYRDRTRPSTIMGRLMAPFSDRDIRELADVLSALEP